MVVESTPCTDSYPQAHQLGKLTPAETDTFPWATMRVMGTTTYHHDSPNISDERVALFLSDATAGPGPGAGG